MWRVNALGYTPKCVLLSREQSVVKDPIQLQRTFRMGLMRRAEPSRGNPMELLGIPQETKGLGLWLSTLTVFYL